MASFRLSQRATTIFTRQAELNWLMKPTRSHFFSNSLHQQAPLRSSPFFNLFSRHTGRRSVQHLFWRRFLSSKPPVGPQQTMQGPEKYLSLSQRLRKLGREYGSSAVGVYFLLSALDFPFAFLAVRLLGTERIGHWEHVVVEWAKRAIPIQWPYGKEKQSIDIAGTVHKVEEYATIDPNSTNVGVAAYDHGVKEAYERNKGEDASIWTQLALAYAVHKSFIFIRVPLTAAITPKVVQVLRRWGWNLGRR